MINETIVLASTRFTEFPTKSSLNETISSRIASQAEVKYVCKRQGGCDITLRSASDRVEHLITLTVIPGHCH